MDFSTYGSEVRQARDLYEHAWQQLLSYYDAGNSELHEAVHYALSNRGKHLRPMLCLLSAHAVGATMRQALRPALAIEMIHTYSLIHDDLPCMDDDHLRRGQPTLHIKYDEARAVLAGDALLTDAFAILADSEFCGELADAPIDSKQLLRIVAVLSSEAGSQGMVLGQCLDLASEQSDEFTIEDLERLHFLKTGALIGAACSIGAIAGGAEKREQLRFYQYGRLIGLAFQIIDDLLDPCEGTGKSKGKDDKQNKLTFASAMTENDAGEFARQMTEKASAHLEEFGPKVKPLLQLSRDLLERKY